MLWARPRRTWPCAGRQLTAPDLPPKLDYRFYPAAVRRRSQEFRPSALDHIVGNSRTQTPLEGNRVDGGASGPHTVRDVMVTLLASSGGCTWQSCSPMLNPSPGTKLALWSGMQDKTGALAPRPIEPPESTMTSRGRVPTVLRLLTGSGPLSEALSRDRTMQLPWIGYRMFKWLLALTIVLVVGLSMYAWLTYPSPESVRRLLGEETPSAERLQALRTLRGDWLASVKDLGQMFLLTPILPLLGAVAGYIFGVSRPNTGTRSIPVNATAAIEESGTPPTHQSWER
jgi:hypothetical protein